MLEEALATLGYAQEGANTAGHFLLLTVAIGGGAAWRTGQAIAQSWGALWQVGLAAALLAGAVRFLHYALFGGMLLSLPSYLVDLVVLLLLAIVAHRMRRTRHMTEQYGWLFERTSPLTWRDRS